MAASKRPSFRRFMTPIGVAVFPKLNNPDTKFKADGEYAVKLRFSQADAEAFKALYIAEAEASMKAAKAEVSQRLAEAVGAAKGKIKKELEDLKAGDYSFKPAYDDEGNETGELEFNFKMPATYLKDKGKDTEKRVSISPDVFDAAGKMLRGKTKAGARLDNVPEVWGGSKLRVSGEFRPYYTVKAGAGVSLRMNAVQIIELRQGGSRDATDYGFGKEEGFEADEAPTLDETQATPAAGAGAEDDQF